MDASSSHCKIATFLSNTHTCIYYYMSAIDVYFIPVEGLECYKKSNDLYKLDTSYAQSRVHIVSALF